jgi:hypothetical protein
MLTQAARPLRNSDFAWIRNLPHNSRRRIMNAKYLGGAIAVLVAVAGCIPSLNPIYLRENLVFDPAVIGEWKQPKSNERWQFTKRDEKSYNLVYTDEQGQQGRFIAHLADIQGIRVLDLFPNEAQLDANGFYKFHLVPIHTVYLVRRTQGSVELAGINYAWLEDYLADHPQAIQHATFGGRKMITAPTEQVQSFVLAHQDAFTEVFQLERLESK